MEYYGKATNSKEKTEEATAREILALTLLGASQEKHTNSDYDENGWLNAYIKEQNKEHVIDINENIVSIDGWEFEIDRSIPAIKGEWTQSRKDNSIQIKLKQEVHVELKKLKIEIETEKEIKTITVNENVIETIPEKTNGKYIIEKEVQEIGNYEIKAIANDDTWNTENIEITEEIPIHDKEDMITFRDLVNSGNTFDGKTVTLKNDIDLEGSNENQWTPIGTDTTQFQGVFDGNSKTIRGLYMDRGDLRLLGLFYRTNIKGEIKRVKLQDCYINSTWNNATQSASVGGITGAGRSIKQCSVTGTLSFNYEDKVTVNTWLLAIGGIAGSMNTEDVSLNIEEDKIILINKHINKVEQYLNNMFIDESTLTLPYKLYLILRRINHDKIVAPFSIGYDDLSDTQEYQATEILTSNYQEIPMQEKLFITLQLLSTSVQWSELHDVQHLPELQYALEEMIEQFEKLTFITFKDKESLIHQLMHHMKPAFYRIRYQLSDVDSLTNSLKEDYKELFHLVKLSSKPLEKFLNQELPDKETVYGGFAECACACGCSGCMCGSGKCICLYSVSQ